MSAPNAQRRPTVVYVMGAGRSGSTILGVALGNCEGVFFAGELDKWLGRHGRSPLGGQERERFWEQVRARVDAEDMYGYASRCLERSSSLLRPRCWRARRRLRRRYREVAQQLYAAVAAVSGAGHVVDTSHYPLRARELQALPGIDLFLVLAVREPHKVVESFGREDVLERRYGPLAANAYMSLTYLLSLWVFRRHPRERRLLVCHEQLLADPPRALRQILDAAGSPAAVPDLRALGTGLPFQGNRLVRQQEVALSPAGPAPARRLLVTRLAQLPWRLLLARARPAVDVSTP